MLAYPADVLVKPSLVDSSPSWIIDYTDTPPFFGRSINYFEDMMREVGGLAGWLQWLACLPGSLLRPGRDACTLAPSE